MEHLIPYPNFRAADERSKVRQIEDYLYQLRETLELALTDIGPMNFSAAFRMELSNLGMEMQSVQTNAEESQQRVEKVSTSQLTVSDVLNSEAYKESLKSVMSEGEDGYVGLPDGTRICYGNMNNGTTVTFKKEYSAVPVLITSPHVDVTITNTGFTTGESSTFSWIAIGRYEEKGD
ncbi:MAG: hypothetical protein IKB07_08170 [Lachnospiraceae bacterium]|nr:hypothetical protein [Lachnospiraceae bacterium]